ncbi:MAG: hypothetical protein RLZZ387_818 [Chloroflexota bacterium]|jgi:hypothetical protein
MAANDWLNQTEELMRTWTKAQQSMWETWRANMPSATAQPAAAETWAQSVQAWQDVMQKSLTAQADFVKFWSESMTSAPMAPAQMQEMSALIADTTRQWTETQSQIYSSWLDAVAKADAAAMAQSWDDGTRKAFETWRATASSAIKAQRKLAESWTGTVKQE